MRKNRKRFDGSLYEYWTLCETIRTERGARQRVVATLGKLDEEDLRGGWDDMEALLDGRRPSPRQADLLAGTPGAQTRAGVKQEKTLNNGFPPPP